MSPPTQAACRWYYARDRKKVGPLTLEELRELAGRGELQPADMLLPEGATRWHPAAEVPAIFETGTTIPPDQAVTTPHIPLAQPAFPPVPGYEVLGELGRGGMGVVYKARQLKLNRTVALKMIRSGAHAGAQERARFLIEAEAVARLSHPNIVQIYEVGEHDGCPFFSLEYVEGGSLSRQVAGTPQPPRDAAGLTEALARALQHAHQHGIIHRDLKPANVLLSFSREPLASASGDALARGSRLNESVPKVTDFGLARRLEEEDERLTLSGVVMGTPSYMAPEQARGQAKDVGPLCDVWALGAILYDLLTGRPPFKGANSAETLLLVTTAEPVSPRQLNPSVPRDLETICLKCLQKEPARRYASAAELADDLKRFLGGLAIKARPVGRVARTWRWCRRNPVLAAVTFALIFALMVGVPGITWKWQEAVENSRQQQIASKLATEKTDEAKVNLKAAENNLRLAEAREDDRSKYVYAFRMSGLPQALKDGQEEAAQRHLEAFQPRPGRKDVRGFEWYVYWKLLHASRLTLFGHNQEVSDLAFSPDGRLLASGGRDTQMSIWDVATGKKLHNKTIDSSIRNLAFAPDGKTLAAGGLDGELTLFRAATAEQVRREAVSGKPTDPGEDLRRETERLRVRALRNLAAFHAREGDSKAQRQTLGKALAEVNRLLSRSPLTPTPLPRGRGVGVRGTGATCKPSRPSCW